MKIGIIGGGTVGYATARAWMGHCDEVRVYDVVPHRGADACCDTLACDLVFICIPEANLDNFFATYLRAEEWRTANLVLKSTVPIGTTRRLTTEYKLPNLVHSPEFLTSRCAVQDAMTPGRLIIGLPDQYQTRPCGWSVLYDTYRARFPGVQVLTMNSDESEVVKLMDNAFGAVKVSLFNEFHSLCEKLELDWDTVLRGLLAGGRIGVEYTQVPGPDGKMGWGGKCWPKDMETLIRQMVENHTTPHVLQAVRTRNAVDRQENI